MEEYRDPDRLQGDYISGILNEELSKGYSDATWSKDDPSDLDLPLEDNTQRDGLRDGSKSGSKVGDIKARTLPVPGKPVLQTYTWEQTAPGALHMKVPKGRTQGYIGGASKENERKFKGKKNRFVDKLI